jgi:hypothetical protein
MKRLLPVGLGLILGFVALLGGAPSPVLAAEPTVSCPPAAKPHVLRHHVVHHYVARPWHREIWTPVGCGTTEHPCNLEHLTVPLE